MRRAVVDGGGEWFEYLLYTPKRGFSWMVETDDGWFRANVLDRWPMYRWPVVDAVAAASRAPAAVAAPAGPTEDASALPPLAVAGGTTRAATLIRARRSAQAKRARYQTAP